MSKQREIAERVAQAIAAFDPQCSILLTGSIGRSEERPDSDIDMNVVSERYNEIHQSFPCEDHKVLAHIEQWGLRLDEVRVEGIKIDLHACTPENCLAASKYVPFLAYGQPLVLRDPTGILAEAKQNIDAYYADHPEILEAWKKQMDEFQPVRIFI